MISETLNLDSVNSRDASRDLEPRLTDAISFPPITYYADGEPLPVVVGDIAAMLNLSIIVDSGLDRKVTIAVNQLDAARVMEELAEQVGATLTYESGLLRFINPQSAGVSSIGVFRTGYDDPAQVVEVTRALLGQRAVIRILGDRLVVGGNNRELSQFSDLSRYLETSPDSWILEVRLVSLSAGFASSIGLDWSTTATLDASLAGVVGDVALPGALTGIRAAAAVAAIAEASAESRDARLLTVCRLQLLEGETSRFQSGDTIPVPRRTVSDQGTVTTEGYTMIDTGFILTATARRVPGGIRLDLEPELSSVNGFVGDAPIVTRRRVTSSAILSSGEWMVLTGFDDLIDSASRDLRPLGVRSSTKSSSQFVVLLRAIRVRSTP